MNTILHCFVAISRHSWTSCTLTVIGYFSRIMQCIISCQELFLGAFWKLLKNAVATMFTWYEPCWVIIRHGGDVYLHARFCTLYFVRCRILIMMPITIETVWLKISLEVCSPVRESMHFAKLEGILHNNRHLYQDFWYISVYYLHKPNVFSELSTEDKIKLCHD